MLINQKSVRCICFLVLVFTACKSHQSKSEPDIDVKISAETAKLQHMAGCYLKVTGRDTLRLKLEMTDTLITGTMAFDNFEKDSSHGTVRGNMSNGYLYLWYDFSAEGMNSHSEQVLKPVDNGLVLGVGEIEVRNDSALFRNSLGVSFPEENLLKRVDCNW